mgnify:CR=1 FL=1
MFERLSTALTVYRSSQEEWTARFDPFEQKRGPRLNGDEVMEETGKSPEEAIGKLILKRDLRVEIDRTECFTPECIDEDQRFNLQVDRGIGDPEYYYGENQLGKLGLGGSERAESLTIDEAFKVKDKYNRSNLNIVKDRS